MYQPVTTQPEAYTYNAQGQVVQPAVAPGPYGDSGHKQPPGLYPTIDQPQPGQPPGYAPGQPSSGYPPGQPAGYPQGQPMTVLPGQRAPLVPMPRPAAMPNVPPGLEYLTQIDQILVHQQMEMLEMVSGWETPNKYILKNALGQQVYFAAEESNECSRQCCGASRGFIIHILDNTSQEVMRVVRQFKCCAGVTCCACSACCAMEVTVEAPVGQVIGHVRQTWSCIAPRYEVLNADREAILNIKGPCCTFIKCPCPMDRKYEVLSAASGQSVGKISKQWTGLAQEMYTDADNFGVVFPMDLDVHMKATMIGAVFLIDFMYFEHKQRRDRHH